MMIRIRTLATGVAALTLAAGAAGAQTPTAGTRQADRADQLLSAAQAPAAPASAPAPVNDGEAYHRADDSEQTPEELRTTRALNDEIASRNQLAENQEQADRARHEAEVAAATQARLAYEEAVRRADAAQSEWDAQQARWQAERARWEADVRACGAGDRTRCSTPARY